MEPVPGWWHLLRRFLFTLDAEHAHHVGVRGFELAGQNAWSRALSRYLFASRSEEPRLKTVLWGLDFPNPIGLAAGFDKDGRCTPFLPTLGFGFVEVGTVTAQGQEGNEKPRMFRLPEHRGLVNWLGFNNEGAQSLGDRLGLAPTAPVPLGINIGKTKIAPLEKANDDYLRSFRAVADQADYVAINVSSPNTPGLRDLQGEALVSLVETLDSARPHPPPLLVKLAPDLDRDQLEHILRLLMDMLQLIPVKVGISWSIS